MRKFFALALAVAMVMSLASVSFAAVGDAIDPNSEIVLSDFHKYDADTNELKLAQAQYGKAYYAMIFEGQWIDSTGKAISGRSYTTAETATFEYAPITSYDDVEKLKIKTDFEMGEDLVESVSIVKKAFDKDSIMMPNPAYSSAADTAGNAWVNGTGSAITAGTYTIKTSDGTAVGTVTLANEIADGKDLAGATPAANGTINKYDTYEITSVSGTDLILDCDDAELAAVTVIEDEIGAVKLEVAANNVLSVAKAAYDTGDKRWEAAADAATSTIATPATGKYYYFVEVKTKAERVTGDADVIGTFEFNRKADAKNHIAKIDDHEVDFAFNLFYEKNYNGNTAYKIDTEDGVTLKWDDLYALKFDNDDEIEIEFGTEPNEGTFTVDVSGQGKLIVDFSTKANDAIADANPGVKMNFVNFNGAKFNRVGEFEYEMENLVAAYQIVDDQLVAINGLEISSDTATFSTRTLGNYVFADAELVNPTPVVEAPAAEAPAVTNPSTGAAA